MKLRVAAGTLLLRGLGRSWSVEWDGLEHEAAARRASPGGNVILAFFHGSLLVLAWTHRARHIHVLVSQHRDGEWIARILARLGHELVRGSSRRGGVEALFQMGRCLELNENVAVTVDGPVGPRYTVQRGVVLLARRTGRPILPMVVTYARGRRLETWDELRVPAFGTQVRVRYLEPLTIPSDVLADGIPAYQEQLETALREGTREAEARYQRTLEFDDVLDRRSYWERHSEAAHPGVALRALSRVHAAGVAVERAVRPRPAGRGSRPWVIGVGNLEAGGTGKTPCVVQLSRAIAARGAAVAVLTRGYGGRLGRVPEFAAGAALAGAADETRLLQAALGDAVPVLVSRDKARGLAALRAAARFDIVVVDDAFQTVGLQVDRHLVLLDAAQPFGNGFLLPAGRLRESPTALRRADALLFTRAGAGALPFDPLWAGRLDRCFRAEEKAIGVRRLDGGALPPFGRQRVHVALLSGLGRPRAFERLARAWCGAHGMQVRRAVRVGDHAPLAPALRKLLGQLRALECRYVLVTGKDAARLEPAPEWNEPLLVFEQRLEIPDLQRLLEVLLPADHSSAKSANVTDSDAGM